MCQLHQRAHWKFSREASSLYFYFKYTVWWRSRSNLSCIPISSPHPPFLFSPLYSVAVLWIKVWTVLESSDLGFLPFIFALMPWGCLLRSSSFAVSSTASVSEKCRISRHRYRAGNYMDVIKGFTDPQGLMIMEWLWIKEHSSEIQTCWQFKTSTIFT